MEVGTERVTQLLINWRNGDKAALDQLMPLVYEELRRLARRFMGKERRDHTMLLVVVKGPVALPRSEASFKRFKSKSIALTFGLTRLGV